MHAPDVKDLRVLVVEPNSSGGTLVKAAKHAGMQAVVASYDDGDRRMPEDLRGLVDELLVVDTNDPVALRDVVRDVHRRAPLAGILPGFEFYVPVVAGLARELGLPALPPETVTAVRDKPTMRDRLHSAGLRVPRHAVASSLDDVTAAAGHTGFPCVLKPADSSGSVHVSRADDLEQLHAAYRYLLADPRRDLGRGLDGRVLVEEYVTGPEISVEGFVHAGGDGEPVTVVAVTEKHLGAEPHFVEIGHIVQADLDPETRGEVEAYTRGVVHALGVDQGTFHCEIRLSAAGPVAIELGARLAGDHIVELVEIATGVSLPRVLLAASTGLDPAGLDAFGAPQAKAAAIHFVTAPWLDTLHEVSGWDGIADLPGLVHRELYLQPGDEIPPAEDFRCRVGHVLYTAESAQEARQIARHIDEAVRCA